MQERSGRDTSGQGTGAPTVIDRVRPIVIFVAAIWVVYLLDLILPLERLGLVPRSLFGLTGIVTMPFLQRDTLPV